MNFAFGWLAAIFFITAAQSTLAYFFSVYGAKPDFILIFICFTGIAAGHTHGMLAGFLCGLLADLLNAGFFGFHVFFLFFAGLSAGLLQNKVFKDNNVFPVALILSFSVLKEAAWALAVLSGGWRLTDPVGFFSPAACRILYNSIIAAPLFLLFDWIRKIANR